MGTSERRMEIIKVLCLRRHETMGNLAFEFGVSQRTIQRDINELTSVIPIYIKAGRYGGGIYVMEHYKINSVYMYYNDIVLLKKISKHFKNDDKLFLQGEEIDLLDDIISRHLTQKTNADTGCPH